MTLPPSGVLNYDGLSSPPALGPFLWCLTSHRPDDATIGPSLLFWRVGARSGFCPISESTMDLASWFASQGRLGGGHGGTSRQGVNGTGSYCLRTWPAHAYPQNRS